MPSVGTTGFPLPSGGRVAVAMLSLQNQKFRALGNEGAIRFYDRLGATSKEKRRYSLRVADGE
ncbi:hypothetical protein GCM10019017_27790 [Streptomyces showdoensis]